MSNNRKRRNRKGKKDEDEGKQPKTNYDMMIRSNLHDFKLSFVATYPFLLSLKLVSNKVNSLKTLNKQPPEESEEEIIYWPMLQSLNLQDNNIKELGRLGSCPSLRDLDLSDNSIHTISEDFEGHEKLVTLDLKINNINSIARLSNLPELKILNLASNKIKEFVGLEGCPSIETLSLRSNNMTAFEEGLPDLENLRDLDLGLNHITKLEEFEKLSIFTSMKSLDVKQNPFIDNNEKNYIFKLISKLPDLEVINDFPITRNMRRQTIDFQIWEVQEQKRLEREEEERLAKEEED